MKRSKKTTRITSITQAAGNNGLPGNLIVNKKGEVVPQNWFSSREFRNALLGAGFSPLLPVALFTGATLTYEELVIEREDVASGPLEVAFPGKDSLGNPRKVTYKQAGVHNINLELNADTLSPEKYMLITELSMKYSRRNQPTMASNAPTAIEQLPDTAPEEPVDADTETVEKKLLATQPKHESLAEEAELKVAETTQ